MKYLKFFEGFVQKNDLTLIVEKGTELFHSTGEDYDINEIRPGGYDDVFWTTQDSVISQTYIPVCGLSTFVSPKAIANPSSSEDIQKIQKQLGIIYDYNEVEFKGNQVVSYKIAPIFMKISDDYYIYKEELNKLRGENKELENELINNRNNIERREKLYLKLKELKKIIREKEDLFYNQNSPENLKNKYVNDILINKYGYTPTQDYASHSDYSWKLKLDTSSENILKNADYKHIGRLFIITPKRDLKIKDFTVNGSREADLTDEDYNKTNWFRIAEKNGYDGIKIPDHCQSSDQGNFGHTSIGLFKSTLKDLNIESVPAVHHDLEPFWKTDWVSPEYKI